MRNVWRLLVVVVTLMHVQSGTVTRECGDCVEDAMGTGKAHARSLRSTQDYDWNGAVDVATRFYNQDNRHRGRRTINMPNIDFTFEKKIGFLDSLLVIRATGGLLGDTTTLHRLGHVTGVRNKSAVIVTESMGLRDLRIQYNQCNIKFLWFNFNGILRGRVVKNAVHLSVKFDSVGGECKSTAIECKVTEFDVAHVWYDFFGPPTYLTRQIGKWVVDYTKKNILAALSDDFITAFQKNLDKFHCDEYATLLMIPI